MSYIRGHNCLTFTSTSVNPDYWWVRAAHTFSFMRCVVCVCVWVCFLHVNTAIVTPANLELGKTRESPGCMDELSDYIYIVVRNCQDCLENMLSCQLTKASILSIFCDRYINCNAW